VVVLGERKSDRTFTFSKRLIFPILFFPFFFSGGTGVPSVFDGGVEYFCAGLGSTFDRTLYRPLSGPPRSTWWETLTRNSSLMETVDGNLASDEWETG